MWGQSDILVRFILQIVWNGDYLCTKRWANPISRQTVFWMPLYVSKRHNGLTKIVSLDW